MQRYTGPSSESPLARLRRQISVYVDPRDTRKRLRRLSDASGRLAFDFETNSLKPENIKRFIHTVAFSFEGADTWAGRIDETCLPALSEVLKNKQTKKIASNLKFEERWSRAKLGHGVASWYWDTMLAAHVLDNRPEISSVKFQAYVRLGVPDYASAIHPYLEAPTDNGENKILDAPLEDLLIYNGLDALLEYQVMEKQREEMGLEG